MERITTPEEKLYLDQLLQAYLNARKLAGVSRKTLREMASIGEKHLIPAFAQKPAQEIKLDEIISVMQAAYPKAATSTKNRYLGYLKAVFRFGLANEMITRNPLANWRKSKEAPRDLKLTLDDLQKIKEVAAPHLAWAITVAWNLGVRTGASELFALKWTDVDWLDSSVRVYASKTKTSRVVPVSPGFLQELQERQQVAQSEFIVEYQGKQIGQFRSSFNSVLKNSAR
ncbi:Putative defective protein IntQ [Fundidesulfovibrio magnetotacticus]|uniref:Defective protein IntQ n=1 Tax=Fundidesulfovibrio magnetotacticus TaxID=2730080 RepID=A0A6V8LYN3_9BACT|nr:site-specific integrase [Fundidesulfovibrio magnetotacticus]GFK95910.1 Putative defective protein IntQ [Fundidesulfovibrio magnetotacticus]